ncbi:MAG: O-antigen ligase family protein [Anaerolineae bacterium]|nr:O-antigen ligase family protein [Anaerolineae bacterium]
MLHSLFEQYKKYRTVPITLGIIATLVLIPFWLRFPNTKALGMGDFTVFYSTGFVVFWPILWTVIWWTFSGFEGFKSAWSNRFQRTWIILLIIFAGWILLSWAWSYKRNSYPSVAIGAAVPFILVILFAICVSCTLISTKFIIRALVFGLVWNSVIAALQVARQGSIGLQFIGEFQVDPAASGTAIVQADAVRWLRPYGLLPHPNMLGGFLVIGLLATLIWIMNTQHKRWIIGVVVFTFGFWCLLLTFSRSAWLGLAAGMLILGILSIKIWWNDRQRLLRVLLIAGIFLIAAGLFYWRYQPFLAARTGVTTESIELRSASDRAVYNQIAIDAIKQSPILGTGIGNFPWYASEYLAKTTFDLRGQPVHNIFLSAWSELGIIGLGLFLAILSLALGAGIIYIRRASDSQKEIIFVYGATIGGIVAFLVIGLFDHYPWTLIQFQSLLWMLMAIIIRPPSTSSPLL